MKVLTISCLILGCSLGASAKEFNLTTATIADIHDAVDAGALTYERLVELYIERIAAYDQHGPALNQIIAVNPRALYDARKLDEEFKAKGRRGPMHGIPMLIKDCIDSYDQPNSGGTLALRNSIPADDAFIVEQLRQGGAVMLGKANLSEFASGAPGLNGVSTLGGVPRNPYNLAIHNDGSSSGTGGALAAVFATVGLGTETGSSVRGPSYHNNIVGYAPTEGLISRDGVIPNSTTLDRVGLMGRYVSDIAAMLNYSIGLDAADPITARSADVLKQQPFVGVPDPQRLKGARLGVFRPVFTSDDPVTQEARALADLALADLKSAGAVLVDPVNINGDVHDLLNTPSLGITELKDGLNGYFASLRPDSPIQSLSDLVADGGIIFNKFERYKAVLANAPGYDSPEYKKDLAKRSTLRAELERLMEAQNLDGLVYLHNLYPAQYINAPVKYTKVKLSSVSGLPGICVPAGFTSLNQPVGIEFLTRAFDEDDLFSIAAGYEQATLHRMLPATTPALPGETFTY
jgi:Asp-tRNA(Asn)/Glu-tRNA(Gln) amidotransferase A subunit family amidase